MFCCIHAPCHHFASLFPPSLPCRRPAASQVQSSVAVQALQPRVKELQAKYAGEPEQLQIETARLYKEAGVNPLAGCLPTLATIPIFIGLYKALTKAADEVRRKVRGCDEGKRFGTG